MSSNHFHAIGQINAWVFDLDNTLYPAECDLFSEVSQRMGEFIADRFGLDMAAAKRLQKQYFFKHGTTLRGLMTEHDVNPKVFLDYVHDIDFAKVLPQPVLAAALARLPGRKFVFTNASANYAGKVLARLGIENCFDGIFDIEAAGFNPKPDPATYVKMLDYYAIQPEGALMVEDIARNLLPAAELGMATAWVPNETGWSGQGADGMVFDYVIDDLPEWLAEMVKIK